MASQREESTVMEPSKNQPLVAISILNWNGWKDTLDCLESVLQLEYLNYLIIVTDNGSWNDSSAQIRSWAAANLGQKHAFVEYSRETALWGGDPEAEQALDRTPPTSRMVLIQSNENLGFTGGNNVAMHYALQRGSSADYVFLLNSDALPEKDCLNQMVSISERGDAGIVGAMVIDSTTSLPSFRGPLSISGMFLMPFVPWQHPGREDVEYWRSEFVAGTAMLLQSDALRKIGDGKGQYFDDRLFLYGEDIQLCVAARAKGYEVVLARRAIVHHKASNKTSESRRAVVTYYLHRNGVLQCRQLLPRPWGTLYYFFGPMLRIAKAVKSYLRGRPVSAKALICGLLDGYCGKTGKWKWHDQEVVRDRPVFSR